MSNNIVAIAIASVGVLGTLSGAAVTQLLSMRARRDDFALQRRQRQEDFKLSCYIAMSTSSRSYRIELMNYLDELNQQTADDAARNVMEDARRACLDSLGQVEFVATRTVRSTIKPINDGLSAAYSAMNNLENGKPQPGGSFEEIKQSLKELWSQWDPMHEAMRQDLEMP
jgi:hypothetical protein